ncbi:porin [Niveibacterium sp. 24ML]|uniref:porin n=1 Tax=Niveibacterium sp. 24ML TaxID=2985512 RepID=UPI0022716BD2|nr:porin [Niveibacterium sp. 24ML]MCX9156829.1 porin [Niveibacterium sp. 24ML]
MQKKLIAAAIAGLVAAPVFAVDTSVTIYGLVDVGYSYRTDHYGDKGSRQGLDSGQLNGSRLGFKGVEQLTPGMKAKFQIEAGVKADTGGSNQGGLAWGRQTWAGLDFGVVEFRFGRQYTPQFNLYANADPFGLGAVAETNNIFTHIAARADNAAYVTTPYFGDVFAVEAMYSKSASGDETVENSGNKSYYSVAPKLKLGKMVSLAANYSHQQTKGSEASISSWDLGGIFDFGVAKLSLAYAQPKDGTSLDANGEAVKYNRWFGGATVPFGNFSLLASYTYSQDKNDLDLKATQFGLGGLYSLSSRTALYAAYSQIDTSNGADAAALAAIAAGKDPAYQVADATNGGYGYRTGFQIGVRHTF